MAENQTSSVEAKGNSVEVKGRGLKDHLYSHRRNYVWGTVSVELGILGIVLVRQWVLNPKPILLIGASIALGVSLLTIFNLGQRDSQEKKKQVGLRERLQLHWSMNKGGYWRGCVVVLCGGVLFGTFALWALSVRTNPATKELILFFCAIGVFMFAVTEWAHHGFITVPVSTLLGIFRKSEEREKTEHGEQKDEKAKQAESKKVDSDAATDVPQEQVASEQADPLPENTGKETET